MQAEGVVHDTLVGVTEAAPLGSGRLAMVHDEPFHCSVSAPLPDGLMPTAMQNEMVRHETAVSPVSVVADPFTWTMDQEVPLHCSIRGDSPPEKSAMPTATQNDVVKQDTSARTDELADGTTGSISADDQVVPFHVCAW
jgi:hypothetical protein